jgi:hypothetical protein
MTMKKLLGLSKFFLILGSPKFLSNTLLDTMAYTQHVP